MKKPPNFYEHLHLRTGLLKQLKEAEEKLADARYAKDEQAMGYAYGTINRLKNELAILDAQP